MDISQIYDSFATEWIDKQVDFDHKFDFQCVDLIRQYWYEKFNIGNAAGGVDNATDYWNDPPSGLLATFQKVATDSPQIGDVVILNFNHIGISNGVVGASVFYQLDQNGGAGNGTGTGADAIQIHAFERSQIMGVLRCITATLPNPITSYEDVSPYNMLTNKQPTNWWNLNGTTTDISTFHPAAVLNINTPFEVAGLAHHINGYIYAMEPQDYVKAKAGDYSTNNGVNIVDLSPPPAPPVVPYVPPAAPVTGIPVEKYTLVTTVKTYATAANAQSGANPVSTLGAGTYIVFSKDNKAYNLTSDNTKDMQQWVNTIDNVAPAVVAPPPPVPVTPETAKVETSNDVKASYRRFFPTNEPLEYRIIQDITVQDMVYSGKPIAIKAGHDIEIYGYFVANGMTYLRPCVSQEDADETRYYYGIRTTDVNSGAPYLDNIYDVRERILYGFEKYYDKATKTIEGIFRAFKNKK